MVQTGKISQTHLNKKQKNKTKTSLLVFFTIQKIRSPSGCLRFSETFATRAAPGYVLFFCGDGKQFMAKYMDGEKGPIFQKCFWSNLHGSARKTRKVTVDQWPNAHAFFAGIVSPSCPWTSAASGLATSCASMFNKRRCNIIGIPKSL